MDNREILEKAIQKAIDGGWKPMTEYGSMELAKPLQTVEHIITVDPRTYIFSHDFAKALWGEEPIINQQGSTLYFDPAYPAWKSHLQQMVIADDPIKYLGEHLD